MQGPRQEQPYLQCLILLLILGYLELKNGGKSIRKDPVFRTKDKKNKTWKFTEVPEDEDEDVRVERARVGEYMASNCYEKPAIMVSGLHKEYEEKGKTIIGKAMRKLVANNISFCVRKGKFGRCGEREILGLVGPNGAGKSTLLDIMVGQTEPNAGQILIGDTDSAERGSDTVRFVGYSPQVNYLWPEVRLEEHLETYGSIKGMSKSNLKEIIKRIVETLDMKEDLCKPAKKLSLGSQRKLCFALSMLGTPDVVLLDEPSNGMDSKAKQRMWQVIRSTFKGKEQAAVLTTHFMEEAEAVCDRVAIMVSGELRYIGSVQHLKSKFGRHFSLDLKLDADSGMQQMELLHREVLKHFPNASRQERFASLMSYKVPKSDVQSLSQAFFNLEQVMFRSEGAMTWSVRTLGLNDSAEDAEDTAAPERGPAYTRVIKFSQFFVAKLGGSAYTRVGLYSSIYVKRSFNVEEYSFSQSTLEQDWRIANVVPIFKKGSKSEPGNYRPVFIELAKEQEEEDNFATMNSTLCWNRTQEDRVAF
ncbi:unnamed protein product [Ranitomeya imitator]|uniref:ABC transporter domain-containing protein n=1 Tax=Ranitomeya imitator TaxID=111125 RepID=A0ABN9MLW3_9NEOB|nr:unnamed protein product [Ranitomeya imitator]